jgi:hypothetical protein
MTSVLANSMVKDARLEGNLDSIMGHSLAVDTLGPADFLFEESEFLSEHVLSQFFADALNTVRKYLSAVHSVPEIVGLVQVAMLVMTAAALYYASQSVPQHDVNKSVATADRHTSPIFDEQFSNLLKNVEKLAREKEKELPPRLLYKARRRMAVKEERKMASRTVGEVGVGELVSIRRFDGKWIEFDYFDYFTGQAGHGWAVKKHFRRKR